MIETIVDIQDANFYRGAYLKLEDYKVIYDDSEGEYGPIEFELEELERKIQEHREKLLKEKAIE